MSAVRSTVIGVVLAAAFVVGVHLLAGDSGREVLALFLALTACVYGGASLSPRGGDHGVPEVLVLLVVFALAVAGLLASPVWLTIGYALHGGWDVLHHVKMIRTPVARWFPPLCASFDVAVGLYCLVA